MSKEEFLSALRNSLYGLPKEDIEKTIDYYSESIDDRIEDGLTETEAVKAIGTVEEIVSQILMETPLPKLVKTKVKPDRSLKAWEIVLLILGAPVWLPLILAAVIIILAVYIVLWSVVVVLYAADLSVAAGAVAGIFSAFVFVFTGHIVQAVLIFGAGLFCAGMAVLMFFGFNQVTKGFLFVSKKLLFAIKKGIFGRRSVK